jgi:hypothetical protein
VTTPPAGRPTISPDAVMVLAHRLVDGIQGNNPAVYFALNQAADVPALAAQIRWWLEKNGVEVCSR